MENEKRRVLMVSCEGLGRGGVQSIMMGIIRDLSDVYHFDMLLFTDEERYYDKEFLTYGGKIIRIPNIRNKKALMLDQYLYKSVYRILKEEQPYVAIHCNNEYLSAPILKAAYKCAIPIRICHTHVVHHGTGFLRHLINSHRIHQIRKYATNLIGCSEEACKALYDKGYKVINNFYDDKCFYKRSYEDEPSVIKLAQVGAISKNKNQLFSIDILKCLIDKGIEAHLSILGFDLDSDYRERINQEVRDKKLQNRITFLPGDANVAELLRTSSFYIQPSYREGFGIALVEAQAVGLHCFASSTIPKTTNCGGVTYIEINESPAYWADIIIKWLKSSKVKTNAYDTTRYKHSIIIKEYKKLYTNCNESTCSR